MLNVSREDQGTLRRCDQRRTDFEVGDYRENTPCN
jgi:hypothetical protein